ncbi:RAD51-associated protein 1 isoform X4 [Rissa tridactyla]|uniref:RAD51-associated protein 1 isoform X4 n=1 Tax=Rissa tridactyla TaxID=75485 RepID=UPI0023BAC14E|nr:RAD51-associated protein 1 isoform X4 [Rissa tridactyla]
MARPVRRNKKVVDYSQFGDLDDDDEDFACIAAPSSKKSRTQLKDPKKDKKEKQKKPHIELTLSQKQTPCKRISLDDKLYQRDLEVALALSVKEKSANILEVQNSEEQGKNIESENVHRRLPFSNCSVDSELLGEDSEEDSDYSEGGDEDFAMEKKKAKGNKKKTRQKMPAEREKKNLKSKINTTASPVVSPSRIMEQKSEPTQRKMSSSSAPVGRPLHTSSPVTDKKPKWIPPALFSPLGIVFNWVILWGAPENAQYSGNSFYVLVHCVAGYLKLHHTCCIGFQID